MSSRAEDKERARQERMRREAEAAAARKRRRGLILTGAVAAVAAVVVVALIAVSQGGSGGSGGAGKSGGGGLSARIAKELAGIPQQGDALGNPNAKVTMTEFGDLQCPACKAYADGVAPQVIANYAKTGKVRLVFKNWLILGPDSRPAAEGALAAGEQGKLWQFVQAFYAKQGQENSGYVTDAFLTDVAKQVKGLDVARWQADREQNKKAYAAELRKIDAAANRQGLDSTPSFLVQPQGRAPQELGGGTVPTYDDVKSALDQALSQAR